MPATLNLNAVAYAFLILVTNAAPGWPQLRVPSGQPRQLQVAQRCDSVGLRLMPPPSLKAYEACFIDKMRQNSSHDWAVPGAEVHAQLDCWCQTNLTSTIQEFGCCNAADVYPMCSTDCNADCNSELAKECVQKCPAMCFEAAEYIVNASSCYGCNWVKCWPVLRCLTVNAQSLVKSGSLDKTCHELDFRRSPELESYWSCWRSAPKHTSHWNVLSSIINCVCRENVQAALGATDCCESSLYGGGACDLGCLSEKECATQTAQTCIQKCQDKCPLTQTVASPECMKDCLDMDAPCRKYVSCNTPTPSGFICDDGRWPEANSGCCIDETTRRIGCPKLCESEKIWRLDRLEGKPWWARYRQSRHGMVAQCTCLGCPDTEPTAVVKLKKTVEEGLWDNGQKILVDIARREGLKYGPNRRMQELMVQRNAEILAVIKRHEKSAALDTRIAQINEKYARLISKAARETVGTPDDRPPRLKVVRVKEKDSHPEYVIVPIICTILILCAITLCFFCRSPKKRPAEAGSSTEAGFPNGTHVVVGQPVSDVTMDAAEIPGGVPVAVTVAAPCKVSPKHTP